ncbi:MAG TPA: 3-isopropylmalate dehydratase large subunit [Phycisphaerales bacterium]|nr:3-isopropylmalate dehydratase large subunit [Phycisphaerales bacterium]
MQAQTLYEKLWSSHVVHQEADGTALIYIDRHLVHEVTSPQAFEGLKLAGRTPWRISSIVATADHNTPTDHWDLGIQDPVSRQQVETLDANIREVGSLAYFPFKDERQGIVHVIGPENGATLPGMTVVCGDSHTSTHGAFGCLAHGIGTSEVEHVMATQCLLQKKSKTMLVRVDGQLGAGVTAKDVVLAIIGKIGTAGGTGYAMEFGGSAIRALSMEGRMTICNMAIEAGGKNGIIAPDAVTLDYVRQRANPGAPAFEAVESDADAEYARVWEFDAAELEPTVACPHSPDRRALARELGEVKLDRAYIGSCTGGKTTDFQAAAEVLVGKHVRIETFIVPATVEVDADLDRLTVAGKTLREIFTAAGCRIGPASCAACLGGPQDTFGRANEPLQVISTTNRNFPGRMGSKDAGVYLASPLTAAASALTGRITDPRDYYGGNKSVGAV